MLRNGSRKAPSQLILIWCTIPYGLEIINAMFHVFQKIFRDTLYKMNDCLESVRSIQRYYNRTGIFSDGLFNYMQACIFSRLKLLFNFYVKRTVRRQDSGAKFNLTYHNGAPVADTLDLTLYILKFVSPDPAI